MKYLIVLLIIGCIISLGCSGGAGSNIFGTSTGSGGG